MNYKKIYDQLVEKCRVRGLDKSALKGYYEKHHIIPKCMGGGEENENFVLFTGREHFIAHMLLWKTHPENVSLMRAAFMMANRKISKINSRSYEALKVKVSSASSELFSGKNNPFFGKKHTDTTREKFKLRPVKRGVDHPSYGKKMSEDVRKKMSDSRKGIPWSEDRKISTIFPTGEDHQFFGKNHSEETRSAISKILKDKNQRPWENLSTQTEESMLKWSMADYYYNLWLYFDKPGLKRFTKIYNELHNDCVSLAFFTNPRLQWMKGWIPNEDSQWLEYRDSHLET